MTLRQLCTLMLPVVAACGGGSSSIDKTQFAAAFAKAYCTDVLTCCAGTSGAPTESSCEATITASTQTQLDMALAKSTQTYHADVAGTCLGQFNTSNCGEIVVGGDSAACNGFITGNVATGGSCTNGTDCVSTFCVTQGNATTGVCTAQVAIGGACYQLVNGGSTGNSCAGNGHISTTFASDAGCVCAAPLADGAACPSGTANTINGDCASLYCGANITCAELTALPAGYCAALFSSH